MQATDKSSLPVPFVVEILSGYRQQIVNLLSKLGSLEHKFELENLHLQNDRLRAHMHMGLKCDVK